MNDFLCNPVFPLSYSPPPHSRLSEGVSAPWLWTSRVLPVLGHQTKLKRMTQRDQGFSVHSQRLFGTHPEQPGTSNFKSEEWEIPGQGIWSVSQGGRQLGAESVSTYSQNDGECGAFKSQPLPQPSQPYLELKYSLRNESTS